MSISSSTVAVGGLESTESTQSRTGILELPNRMETLRLLAGGFVTIGPLPERNRPDRVHRRTLVEGLPLSRRWDPNSQDSDFCVLNAHH